MSINRIRERVNLLLSGHKEKMLRGAKIINGVVSFVGILTRIFYYGFKHSTENEILIFNIISGSFAYYVFHYLLRIVYDFHPLKYLRSTWHEAIIMLWWVVEGFIRIGYGTLPLRELV